jgi:hypothetical protein
MRTKQLYKVIKENETLRAIEELGDLLFKIIHSNCREIDPELIDKIHQLSKIIHSN